MNHRPYAALIVLLLSSVVLRAQFAETGFATYYADYLAGRPTAYGEHYLPDLFTAAHPKHPLHTLVKVTRIDNGRSVTVRINDRGPFKTGYIIDLSKVAARYIGLDLEGKTKVRLEVVGYAESNLVPDDYVAQSAPASEPIAYQTGSTNTSGEISYNPTEPIRRLKNDIGGFGIQLASYTLAINAERRVRELQAQGIKDIYIREKASNYSDETLYKIIIARFTNEELATQQLEILRSQFGLNGFVTRL